MNLNNFILYNCQIRTKLQSFLHQMLVWFVSRDVLVFFPSKLILLSWNIEFEVYIAIIWHWTCDFKSRIVLGWHTFNYYVFKLLLTPILHLNWSGLSIILWPIDFRRIVKFFNCSVKKSIVFVLIIKGRLFDFLLMITFFSIFLLPPRLFLAYKCSFASRKLTICNRIPFSVWVISLNTFLLVSENPLQS